MIRRQVAVKKGADVYAFNDIIPFSRASQDEFITNIINQGQLIIQKSDCIHFSATNNNRKYRQLNLSKVY